MFQDKFPGFGMQAKEEHGSQGKNGACGKYQVQGEYVSQEPVNNRGQGAASDGCRTEETQDSASIRLGKGQHHGSVKYGVSGAVAQTCKERQNEHGDETVRKVGRREKKNAEWKAQGHNPESGFGGQFYDAQCYHAQQGTDAVCGNQVAIHIHGKTLFQAERKKQGKWAGTQQVQNQRADDKKTKKAIGKNGGYSTVGIQKYLLQGHRLALLDGWGNLDK